MKNSASRIRSVDFTGVTTRADPVSTTERDSLDGHRGETVVDSFRRQRQPAGELRVGGADDEQRRQRGGVETAAARRAHLLRGLTAERGERRPVEADEIHLPR